MRVKSNVLSIISNNIEMRNRELKQKQVEQDNKQKEIELENAKKSEKLRVEERELKNRHIDYLETQRQKLKQELKEYKNPVVISFSSDEFTSGKKYLELKDKVESTRAKMLEARTNIISSWYIFFSKIGATLFFIFILIRLSSGNEELIESFTFLTVFQNILGEEALFLDFFFQDIPLISAISFLIAVGFRDYDSFFTKKTRTNLYIAFVISIFGLFISSMLFSY